MCIVQGDQQCYFKMPIFVTSPLPACEVQGLLFKERNYPKLTPEGSALTPAASSHY